MTQMRLLLAALMLALCGFFVIGARAVEIPPNPGPWTNAAWTLRVLQGLHTPDPATTRGFVREEHSEPPQASPEQEDSAPLQCKAVTLHAKPLGTSGKFRFSAIYAPEAFQTFLDEGCLQIEKGCNSCVVRYSNCESLDAVKSCQDGECMAEICDRKVICTAKFCSAEGESIDCNARLARYRCLRPLANEKPAERGSVRTPL